MELKELDGTGVNVPEIGLGTWQYRGGPEPLRRGISLGATLIDTAEGYGTEGVVGEAVKGQRDGVFIATKVSGSHLRHQDLLRAADDSLKRMGIDHIDLYQIHWPNPRIPIAETMGAMEALVDSGKVRFIGVSNFSQAELEEAQRAMSKHRIVSNQVLYNLLYREIEIGLIPYCERHDIAVLAYSPLARGSLTSRPLLPHRKGLDVLQDIAQQVGKSMPQVALNWCVSRPPVIAIPKANLAERVEEDCQASGWRLSSQQLEALDNAFP